MCSSYGESNVNKDMMEHLRFSKKFLKWLLRCVIVLLLSPFILIILLLFYMKKSFPKMDKYYKNLPLR